MIIKFDHKMKSILTTEIKSIHRYIYIYIYIHVYYIYFFFLRACLPSVFKLVEVVRYTERIGGRQQRAIITSMICLIPSRTKHKFTILMIDKKILT